MENLVKRQVPFGVCTLVLMAFEKTGSKTGTVGRWGKRVMGLGGAGPG